MKMPNSPSRSGKITVVANRCEVTFPYLLWILLSFTTFWNVGCGISVDDRVYACSTSSDCGAGWVCQCAGDPIKGGRCVGSVQAMGVFVDCSNISTADVQKTDSDIGAADDISELVDSRSDTVDSADVTVVGDISEPVDSRSDTVDSVNVTADIWWHDVESVDLDGSIEPDAPDSVVGPPDGMIYIPSGTFWMGCNEAKDSECSPDEYPQHEVTLSGYFIDMTEVTVAAYQACVFAGVCTDPGIGGHCNYGSQDKSNHPINCVTWCQARAYCVWKQKRLPTEAEWEMAARGGCEHNVGDPCKDSMRIYPWGGEMATCEYAVMYENGLGCAADGTWDVGSKPKGDSPYGVKDLSGNIWEWVEDCYSAYSGDSVLNPPGASCAVPDERCQSGDRRVARGGGFSSSDAGSFRASYRVGFVTSDDYYYVPGFRCAKSIP